MFRHRKLMWSITRTTLPFHGASVMAQMTLPQNDQPFVLQVGLTVAAKFIDGASGVNDEMARTMVLAMLLVAAADGQISTHEEAVMTAFARTVPELKSRDFGALLTAAKERLPLAEADFQAMPRFKNKTYA